MKKIYTLILVLFCFFSYAQNVEFEKDNFKDKKDAFKEARSHFEKGNEFFEQGPDMYRLALQSFMKANDFNSNNALLNYRIGMCFLHSRTENKLKGKSFVEKAFQLKPDIAPDIHYYLGRGFHLNLELDKAEQAYTKFRSSLKPGDPMVAIVTKNIEEVKVARKLVSSPVRAFIDNLGSVVNSKYSDYTPIISADEDVLYFTSRKETSTGGELDPEGEYFEDIYVSYKFNDKWTSPVNIGAPINTKGHDAGIALSPDGQKLFIYIDDNGDGNIYECTLEGEKWSKPEQMPKPIKSKGHESGASISFDGKVFYFISDREGGLGDRDIYMCTKNEKGKWGDAVNLGPTINTPYTEKSVFMMPDGKTMYFSSSGHNSMGGQDLFITTFENGVWSTPKNVGYPINTPDDDHFFVVSANGKHGYYSSSKEGTVGEVDLYMVTFLGPEKQFVLNTEDNLLASIAAPVSETVLAPTVSIATSKVTILKGIVMDFGTLAPLEANLELTDNNTNLSVAQFKSNSKSGKYLVSLPSGKNYGLSVKADGYLFHSENFDIPESEAYKEVTLDVKLKKVEVGSTIVLKNIFFDFDKATLRNESTAELERLIKLLNDNPTLKIEISGHTDNKGAAQYNLTLSDNRSKSVVDYLVAKGISKDRLTWKGYGLTKPIATNETDEGRQMNRRTEFKILSK